MSGPRRCHIGLGAIRTMSDTVVKADGMGTEADRGGQLITRLSHLQ